MFDLSRLDTSPASNAGVDMPVKHPATGKPVVDENTGAPVTIRLIGRDSERFVAAQREVLSRRIRDAQAGDDTDFEASERDTLDLLASCTVQWSGIGLDGEDLEFSHDAALTLYGRLRWLREQVDAFVSARENFLPKPALN
ncbi:hypothetical protein SAMN02745157_4863 [Kaistia soli DSM 19436]|uniref:Uncharacterized protein n=1 Tax=Kaistia soli DSM 19436 TaxID=1122133 RepID=A0A1M5MT16_9HYPH|nr:hypothetical protein [Kaistia soli]SHG79933.1 hypothetical protein SAMN02745157_4863 [Kaistia soli DSM 19436]